MVHYSQGEFSKAFDHGCAGKEPHETEAAAQAAHDFRVRVKAARSGDGAAPYFCEFCGKWHIGHSVARTRGLAPTTRNNSRNA